MKEARSSARRRRRATCGHRFAASAHSHTRSTVHPALRSVRTTSRSRVLLRENFAAQYAARVAGCVACRGQPCQKHPSTNTATFAARKTKSGFPNTRCCRRQPVIPCARSSAIIRSSVAAFPLPRIAAITALRFALVKMSVPTYFAGGSTRSLRSLRITKHPAHDSICSRRKISVIRAVSASRPALGRRTSSRPRCVPG